MQSDRLTKQSDSRFSLCRLLLSIGLSLLLLLALLGKQIFHFDDIGWSNGFNHPLTGWDHLLTMLAVGIWAAQLRGQAFWMLPLAFVGVMSLGGLAGAAGLAIPSVEGIILLSCAVFSVLIARKVRFSTKINVLIVAFFAFFHGFAHGQEISTSASLISYTLGFMLATLLLHGAGILVAKLVVFGFTCLLTIMFSNAALAKTAESILDDKANAPVIGLMQMTSFGLATDQTGYENHYFAIAENLLPSEKFSRHDAGGGCHETPTISVCNTGNADIAKTPPRQTNIEKLKLDGHGKDLIVDKARLQALLPWEDAGLLSPDDTNGRHLSFRHYYPAINHTPGKQLLSNGVGLNSPPAAILNVLASQASPHFRNTAISFIEEPHLQLTLATLDTGNSVSKSVIHCKHDCARTRRNVLQSTVIHCFTPFEIQIRASDLVSGAMNCLKEGYG